MKKLFAGALLVVMSTPALAEQPSYDFFELTWQHVELDDSFIDIDGDGFGLSGSVEIAENWHIIAGYSDLGLSFGADLTEFAIGAGFHTAISDNTSVYADLAWINIDVDTGTFGSADDSGVGAAVGIRSFVTDSVELQGSLSYVDLGDGLDGTSFGAGAWYHFTDAFALGVIADFEDDASAWGVSGRFFF